MTAVGEPHSDSHNSVNEGSDFPKKHKKRKHRNSGEEYACETLQSNASEVAQEGLYAETKKHKRKKHKSSENYGSVDMSTQNTELDDQYVKKHRKHHEHVGPEVTEKCVNRDENCILESMQESTTERKSKKRHKSEKNSEEANFTQESTQDLPTETKRKKRHKSGRNSEETEKEQQVILDQRNDDGHNRQHEETALEVEPEDLTLDRMQDSLTESKRKKRHKSERNSGEAEKSQQVCLDTIEKKKKKHKRHHRDAPEDESHSNLQETPRENGVEAVVQKSVEVEANAAASISESFTAIDKHVLKQNKQKPLKEKLSDGQFEASAVEDALTKEPSGGDKTMHKKKEKEHSLEAKTKPKQLKAKKNTNEESKAKDMTEDERQQLFSQLLKVLPSSDQLHYKARELFLDWNLVKFNNFSAEYCKSQWLQAADKVRKIRTLAEIVQEAKNRGLSKKQNPAYRLPQITVARVQILKEICVGLREEYPDATEDELLIRANKKYIQLSKEEKKKYTGEPRTAVKTNDSGLQLYIDKKVKEYFKTHPTAEHPAVVEKFRKRWHTLSDRHREKYNHKLQSQKSSGNEITETKSERKKLVDKKLNPVSDSTAKRKKTRKEKRKKRKSKSQDHRDKDSSRIGESNLLGTGLAGRSLSNSRLSNGSDEF